MYIFTLNTTFQPKRAFCVFVCTVVQFKLDLNSYWTGIIFLNMMAKFPSVYKVVRPAIERKERLAGCQVALATNERLAGCQVALAANERMAVYCIFLLSMKYLIKISDLQCAIIRVSLLPRATEFSIWATKHLYR